MTTADDLLHRAREYLPDCSEMAKDIDEYLAAPKDEPVYLARRKGLDDFFTCSKERYEELSVLDLFETKLAYLHPPTKTAPKPMTEEEILDACPVAGVSGHLGFKYGVRFAERHHGIGGGDNER